MMTIGQRTKGIGVGVWLLAGLFAACGGGGGGRDAGVDPGGDLPEVGPDVALPEQGGDEGGGDGWVDETHAEATNGDTPTQEDTYDWGPDPVGDAMADTPGPDGSDPGPLCEDASCVDACEGCASDPCGDQTCDASKGENCSTCPQDCGVCPLCGNQVCEPPSETCGTCVQDCGPCPPVCPDGACNGQETCETCPDDCGPCIPVCPDGFCNGYETCVTCPKDCGACPPMCGDGSCNGVETCVDCPEDCGECSSECGDGKCLNGETCQNCPGDCGDCPPTLWFRVDWSETLDAPIVAGGKLRIRYDLDRLTECRQTHNGFPGWTITVFYTDDLTKPANQVQVVQHGPQGQTWPIEPVIDVPEGARDLWFWANNTGVEGCIAWDSDYGKNYMMPVFQPEEVAQPVPWIGWGPGGLDFVYVTEGGSASKGDVDPVWIIESLWGAEVTTEVRIQAYVPGITDRVYQNAAVASEVAHTALLMKAHTDFAKGAGFPGAEKVLVPLEFDYQANNNFYYRWRFGQFGYVFGIANGPPPKGLYGFWLTARTPKSLHTTVVGRQGDISKPRGLVYAKNPVEACPLFPQGTAPTDICP